MIWTWALLGLLFLGLLTLFIPVQLRFCLEPFEATIAWLGFGLDLSQDDQGTKKKVRLLFFSIALKNKKKPGPQATAAQEKKAKKPKKKKQRKRKIAFSVAKAKNIWAGPLPKTLYTRLLKLLKGLGRSLGLREAEVVYGGGDAFTQGILAGAFSLVPLPPKIQLHSNFEGQNNLEVKLTLLPWRILQAVATFLVTLPYWRAWQTYQELLEPTPKKGS